MTLTTDALAIARAGVRAVDPGRAVRRTFARRADGYQVGPYRLRLNPSGALHLVAIGKAAGAMVDAAVRIAGSGARGIAISPDGYPPPRSAIRAVLGDHPVPRERSFRAGAELLRYVRTTHPDDSVLFLISGGGSATVEVPAASLDPDEVRRTTEVLLASGAPIGAMNAVRRHISAIKGGQLAAVTAASALATLAVSDVVGDVSSDIASGPTVADPSTFRDALAVVRRYRLGSTLPSRVVRHLRDGERGLRPETPKSGDPRLGGESFVLAATNRVALQSAAVEARHRGYSIHVQSDPVVGETQPAARKFAHCLARLGARARVPSIALLAGGETTVTLGLRPGHGGRNQEFCLAAASVLAGLDAVVVSIGTDGIDGPTDAAGGWTDGGTVERSRSLSVDLRRALRSHSAYDALELLGSLVRTGPTGTNVMDLHVGLVRRAVSRNTAESSRRNAVPSSRRRPS